MTDVAYYVSSHGYGHATRTLAILRELAKVAPGLNISVRTGAPGRLFLPNLSSALDIHYQVNDIGVVQSDGLTLDGAATLKAYARFLEERSALLDAEVRWVQEAGVRMIVGDIPPLAFAVAARASIPSVAIGNFDWDWIYREWTDLVPGSESLIQSIQADYGQADLLLRLPFHDKMSAFAPIEDVPLVGRRARLPRDKARRRAGIPLDARAVLLSFGGMGLSGADLTNLANITDHHFVSIGETAVPGGSHLSEGGLHSRGLLYEDLVGAVDVVATKPGYGIVSECAVNHAAMLYTDRGTFREYPILSEGMRRYFPAVHIDNESLRAGLWSNALECLAAEPWPEETPPADGARVVAERLVQFAENHSA